MGRYIYDENILLLYVATIDDPDAPTLAELQAGVDITGFIVEFETPDQGTTVDTPDPTSKWDKTISGTRGGSITGQFYRDDEAGESVAWDTLPHGADGFFVVRDGQGAGDIAADDVVSVFPMDTTTRQRSPYRRNNRVVFDHGAGVPDTPSYDVTVPAAA